MAVIFQRRPLLSVITLILIVVIYIISLLKNPSDDTPPSSWTHSWPETWLNGAPPLPPEYYEDLLAQAQPSDSLDTSFLDFRKDIPSPLPSLDLSTLAHHRPHNHNQTGHHPTYATYYASRNASLHDPYFIATLHLIYLTLYSPTTSPHPHPFTVFIPPFISSPHREIFLGAGAAVIELPLVEWHSPQAIYAHWRDLFSKLHIWTQTQFSLIAVLDSDAFPLQNIADIFRLSPPQTCRAEHLLDEDLVRVDEICDYVFAGVEVFATTKINAGVIVLKPNAAMHARLLRNMVYTDSFDISTVEQGLFNWQFNASGPFPTQFLPRAYNGFFPQPSEKGELKVVHEKLWTTDVWEERIFDRTHEEMVGWFDSAEFLEERERDGVV